MSLTSNSRTAPASDRHARELAEALHLVAHGTLDEKVRFIAERDPDWFVDHVLTADYVDRDETAPGPRVDARVLDAAVARLALRDRTFPALRSAG